MEIIYKYKYAYILNNDYENNMKTVELLSFRGKIPQVYLFCETHHCPHYKVKDLTDYPYYYYWGP